MSVFALHSGRAAGLPIAWAVTIAVGLATPATIARAATIDWKGHTWQLTSGGMAGNCQGDPNNVTLDSNGYLHLRISHDGGTWSAAELFTTDRLGFGTYQWQVDGPIDTFDPNVVLGLFPYGPAAGIGSDGTNEIDIEYSRWGTATGPNGDWTDYPASGSTVGELSYTFSLNGSTLSTSRFVWFTSSISDFLFSGLVNVTTTVGSVKTWTYQPQNATMNIPQQALPLGMNLWCFNAPPSDGNPVEVVIRDFVFVAVNNGTGGAGTGGGTSGTGGASSAGGAQAAGGTTVTGGTRATGGGSATGGLQATGGNSASGGAVTTGGVNPIGGSNATGGINSLGGSRATGGTTSASNAGGATAFAATGGSSPTAGGVNDTGGVATTSGGYMGNSGGSAAGGQFGTGGALAIGGVHASGGFVGATGATTSDTDAGTTTVNDSSSSGSCSCRVAGGTSHSKSLTILGVLGLLALQSTRRRR